MKTTQHQQLAEDLLAQIADGTFAVGDRLPTEEQLCADYGLARGTVRRALGRLDELGLISRRPRAGTTVIASIPMAGYQPVAQSAADIVALAAETRLVKPDSREVLADAALARRIGVRRGTAWFLLEGVRARRGRDEAGLCWSEHYLRGDLPREHLIRGKFTADRLASMVVEQTISASLLDARMAAALDAEPGSAALIITRRNREQSGRLVSVGIHSHPADRYAITMVL
jgi:DNA-binding GntR family transcriptional regulator